MTVYPTSLDSALGTAKTNTTTTDTDHPAHHNEIDARTIAIETELGTLPKGSFTNVAARLNARLTCRKTADTSNSTTTLANITDLVLPVSTTGLDYYFEFWVPWSTATAGTMAQFAVTVPAVTGYVVYWTEALGGSTVVPTTGGAAVTFDQLHTASASAQTATGGSAAAPPTAAVIQVTRIQGILSNPSATGTVQLQHKSETAVATTIKRGAYGEMYIN